jgi:hypothetical protein
MRKPFVGARHVVINLRGHRGRRRRRIDRGRRYRDAHASRRGRTAVLRLNLNRVGSGREAKSRTDRGHPLFLENRCVINVDGHGNRLPPATRRRQLDRRRNSGSVGGGTDQNCCRTSNAGKKARSEKSYLQKFQRSITSLSLDLARLTGRSFVRAFGVLPNPLRSLQSQRCSIPLYPVFTVSFATHSPALKYLLIDYSMSKTTIYKKYSCQQRHLLSPGTMLLM